MVWDFGTPCHYPIIPENPVDAGVSQTLGTVLGGTFSSVSWWVTVANLRVVGSLPASSYHLWMI